MDATHSTVFVDRRGPGTSSSVAEPERRQFADSRDLLSAEVRELAEGIDSFKRARNRRYITLAEVLEVVKSLGYRR